MGIPGGVGELLLLVVAVVMSLQEKDGDDGDEITPKSDSERKCASC